MLVGAEITQEHMKQAERIMGEPGWSVSDTLTRYAHNANRGQRKSKAWKALGEDARALFLLLIQISRFGIADKKTVE